MANDYQLTFSHGQPLAAGDSDHIVQMFRGGEGKFPVNGNMSLFLTVDIGGFTGAATGDFVITLSQGDLADGSDMAGAATYSVPMEQVLEGRILVVSANVVSMKYQKLTYAPSAGITGGYITAGYSWPSASTAGMF